MSHRKGDGSVLPLIGMVLAFLTLMYTIDHMIGRYFKEKEYEQCIKSNPGIWRTECQGIVYRQP